jgi:DNA polymerase
MKAEEMTREALVALLDWYVESGVDLALDDAPHDRYADSAHAPAPIIALEAPVETTPPETRPSLQAPAPRPRIQTAVAAPDEAIRAAQAEAAAARDLDDLASRLAHFAHAPFRDMAEHFLFALGPATPKLMAFDAAPGASEESGGVAFSGERAQLLDNMLAAIGQSRETVRLAYVAPWRPPGDKLATPQEVAIFAPFARRHLELARPEIVLLFGETPARALLETNESVSKLRGKWIDVSCGAHTARAMVFSSLDAMLKSWSLKPAAWRDLRVAAAALKDTR